MRKLLTAAGIVAAVAATSLVVLSFSNSAVPILMYHNIGDGGAAKVHAVAPGTFRNQVMFLKRNGFSVISLEEFTSASASAKLLPYKCVVLTFDDGYENNYQNAFPVLREAGYPATLFIPSDFIGQPGYITVEQAKEMAAHKVTIGAHGKTHDYLTSVTPKKLHDEIQVAKERLEAAVGQPVRFFCYPLGAYNEQIKKWVKTAGYSGACTTNRSPLPLNNDVYALNRIKMTERDVSDPLLWAKTSRIYNLLRGFRNFFRNTGCGSSRCG